MHDIQSDGQATLTIDLDALKANWRMLAARAGAAECGAAVKADAYGLGIERAVPALARAGCRTFFVAHVAEGVRARGALRDARFPDGQARVFVLSGFHPDIAPLGAFRAFALGPVLGSGPELTAWSAAIAGTHETTPAAIHVDTGLNRLGFPMTQAQSLGEDALRAARATVLMSHFCSAEEPDNPMNATQIARFAELRRRALGRLPASLANSSGLFLPQPPTFDLVRPGFALYGGNPTPGHPNPMRPVVRLEATILQVREVDVGDPVGYGSQWTAPRPSRLATIGVGYADGLPRNAKSFGSTDGPRALVGVVPCPLVGRVSMDLSVVDVTDAPAANARPGAPAVLLDETVTVDDLARQCGTIGYEILTSLGRRYRRHYKETA